MGPSQVLSSISKCFGSAPNPGIKVNPCYPTENFSAVGFFPLNWRNGGRGTLPKDNIFIFAGAACGSLPLNSPFPESTSQNQTLLVPGCSARLASRPSHSSSKPGKIRKELGTPSLRHGKQQPTLPLLGCLDYSHFPC